MAFTPVDTETKESGPNADALVLQANGTDRLELPSADFIADAKMTRDGDDLVLETPAGEVAVIEGYFSADPAPLLHAADGAVLTPNLVNSFVHGPMEFAANQTATDESPVGAVEEVKGNATVTRADGTVETITIGTPIYQGDIVETDAKGAVNITFIDETTMAVSENARLAVKEYTFDPETENGTTNFSMLRGLFVFTSGLIGRDDPDDVKIETPVGSIGIRGTIIAGQIDPSGESNISVLEGAIVVKNGAMETTLSEQFETVKLGGYDEPMQQMGVLSASDISTRFSSIGSVSPSLFTTINDSAREHSNTHDSSTEKPAQDHLESAPKDSEPVSSETAPETLAPPPAPLDLGIITLTGDTTGLPGTETVLGTTITSLSSTETNTVTTTVLEPTVVTTAELPPPPPPTTLAAPPALGLSYVSNNIQDIATAGAVIGHVTTGLTGSSYTLASAPSPYYTLVAAGNGVNIVLTAAGANYLATSLDTLPLGNFSISATDSLGRSTSGSFTAAATDANLGKIIDLDLASPPGVSVIRDSGDYHAGYTVTALGDINGDGFDDFAFSNNTNLAGQNHSYIAYGSASHLASLDIPDLITAGDVSLTSNPEPGTPGAYDGTKISGIGDFDGDGIEDYVIGQMNNHSTSATSTGFAAIVSGANPADNIKFSLGSAPAGSEIGSSISGVGDFNNDGYSDVIIGAPGTSTGTAYLVKGGSDLSSLPDLNSTADTAISKIINGSPSSSFGKSVADLGDFNGDGYSDFAVGAPDFSGTAGQVKLFAGNKTGTPTPWGTINGTANDLLGTEISGLGDINGDGKSDMLVLGDGVNNIGKIYLGGDTTVDAAFNIPLSYKVTGAGTVGDFNGDGYDDFSIALADSSGTHAYIVLGKSSFGGSIDLNYLKNPLNAVELQYSGANNTDSLAINGIGDVNGDGYDDFAMGVPDANGVSAGSGGLMLVYGRDTGGVTAGATASANGQSLLGTSGANTLSDGNMTQVSLRGGAGNDVFEIHNTNFLGIDGGSNSSAGSDIVRGFGNLDFSALDFEKISGIETIQYSSTGQVMTLTMENIFNLLKTSDTGSLKIDSAFSGSDLVLDVTTVTGTTTADKIVDGLNEMGNGAAHAGVSGGYDEFNIGGYKLYIDTDLTVSVV